MHQKLMYQSANNAPYPQRGNRRRAQKSPQRMRPTLLKPLYSFPIHHHQDCWEIKKWYYEHRGNGTWTERI